MSEREDRTNRSGKKRLAFLNLITSPMVSRDAECRLLAMIVSGMGAPEKRDALIFRARVGIVTESRPKGPDRSALEEYVLELRFAVGAMGCRKAREERAKGGVLILVRVGAAFLGLADALPK